MARQIEITGLCLHANSTPCAYHCRYCQLVTSKARPIPFARYAALVECFIDWRAASGRADFGLWPWFGNSYEHALPILAGILRLDVRLGQRHQVLLLGGLRHRPMAEMRAWLAERGELGIDTLVATFSGYGEIHDHWNGQQGNYRFQMDCLHLAAEMGMKLQQRVLLMRGNLPTLEKLFDDLDRIEARFNRWAIPMFYSGRARRLENERLDEADFAALPPRLRACLREDWPNWRSERQWLQSIRQGEFAEAQKILLSLDLSPAGLEWAEGQSCDAIVDQLSKRYRGFAQILPSPVELAERYGNASNTRVYFNQAQMERVWLERYLEVNPDKRLAVDTLFP